jgi:hypothetical protein
MSRSLEARLRKLETRAGLDEQVDVRTLSDEALFARSQAEARALVAQHGSLTVAEEAMRAKVMRS